jgi:hypothetical protein
VNEQIPAPVPRAADAIVPDSKLRDYLLDPDHETGADKARFFRGVLGIERDDSEYLKRQLLAGVLRQPAIGVRATPYGISYVVEVELHGRNGRRAAVTTIWAVAPNAPPRFITAYPAPRMRP